MTANTGNLEPVHVPQTSTDPVDAGFKRAVADGDLARNFRTWAHTFIGKESAETPGFMMAAQETDADWIKLAAQFLQISRRHQRRQRDSRRRRAGVKDQRLTSFLKRWRDVALKRTRLCAALAQTREVQLQTQQTQSQIMQIMAAIFSDQLNNSG
jgi:hypothetical protein